jgi:hypothetical protein
VGFVEVLKDLKNLVEILGFRSLVSVSCICSDFPLRRLW